MITITHRNFLPDKLKVTSWESLAPLYENLLNRKIGSREDLEQWLRDRSELEAFVSEDLAWRYVKMTCDTTNRDLEASYLFFVQEIEPRIAPETDKLNKKLMESKYINELDEKKYYVYLR